MADTLSAFLGRLIANTSSDDISPAARERARVSLAHDIAVALAGRQREKVAWRLAQSSYSIPAQATLLHNGARVSSDAAAFANGALFHARSQDDTHPDSTSHPGAPVIAAALALAEETRANGREFLDAMIIGYEVLCRIGRDFDQQVTGRGYRAAAVFGIFGATAAASRLLKLDAVQAGHALALATHMTGGLAQVWHEGSPEFPLQLGAAAKGGIMAARAAAAGAVAASAAFEGPRGFYNAYAGISGPIVEATASYGHWQVEEATVKPYPACAILQGPLALLCQVLARENLTGSDVRSLDLYLSPYEAGYPGIDNRGPFASATATKMSAQFCLGNALSHRRLALTDLEQTQDPQVLREAVKVRVVPTDDIPERLCRLRIETVSGRMIEQALSEPIGRPSFDQIRAFCIGLADEIGAEPRELAELCELIATIDNLPEAFVLAVNAARTGFQAA